MPGWKSLDELFDIIAPPFVRQLMGLTVGQGIQLIGEKIHRGDRRSAYQHRYHPNLPLQCRRNFHANPIGRIFDTKPP
jgi:hypothetical protein